MKRSWGLILQVLNLAERGELADFKKDRVEGFQYHVDLCKQKGLVDEDARLTWDGHDALGHLRLSSEAHLEGRAPEAAASGRAVLTHNAPGLNEMLRVEALGEPGRGGANQVYRISGEGLPATVLRFQTGAVCDVGLLGISNEAVLAVVEDRLRGFQKGPFSCHENDVALDGIGTALGAMHRRTMSLQERFHAGGESTPPPNPASPDPVAENGGPAGESEKQSSGPLPPTEAATPPAAVPLPVPAPA